ncbi:MAG: hypothetical protein IJH34_04940 [Romboutsia sp.]|nr:hypothetical protein [Bacilli bacterium]MBQ3421006.1 hypothetical protein [Romboutsia sp.]
MVIIKEKYLRIVESTLKGVEKKETRLKLLNTTTDEEIKELFEDIAPMIDIKTNTNFKESTFVHYEILEVEKNIVIKSYLKKW